MFNLFKRKKNEEDEEFFAPTDDLIVIFDDDNKTSVIERISYIQDGNIYVTGKHAVPVGDAVLTNGVEGRIFFYKAPEQSIQETRRLAQLERSLVLNQITAYKPPEQPNSMDWTKLMLFGLVFVAFIVIGFSGCSFGSIG